MTKLPRELRDLRHRLGGVLHLAELRNAFRNMQASQSDANRKRHSTAVLICAIGDAKVVPTILSSGNHFGIRREASVGNT